jgi:hypothetical protein
MGNFGRYVLLAAILAVGACGTIGGAERVEREAVAHAQMPASIDAAILYGEQLNAFYAHRGSSLASNRRWMALGVLAANTFVLAASGVEAHPDTIFAGALVGSTIRSVDPIVNAGGPGAWEVAHARNVCAVAVAWGLNTSALFNDTRLLRRSLDPESAAAALQRYDAYPARLVGVMREIHARYLRDTTPDIPAVNAVAQRIIDQRAAEQPEVADDGGDQPFAAESAAVVRLIAALDLADAELPKCRPPTQEAQPQSEDD